MVDANAIVLEVLDVGVSLQEPKQFVYDTAKVELFSGHAGKALGQVEAHLMAKDRQGSGSCSVLPLGAVVQDGLQEIEVVSHVV